MRMLTMDIISIVNRGFLASHNTIWMWIVKKCYFEYLTTRYVPINDPMTNGIK